MKPKPFCELKNFTVPVAMSGLLMKTPVGVCGLRDIAQPCVRIQRCLQEEPEPGK
jgi:hypothetical protein